MKIRRFLIACLCVVMITVAITGPTQALPLPYYGTYIGGSDDEVVRAISLDTDDAYVTGVTDSTDFTTTIGALYEDHCGGTTDVFVVRVKNLSDSNHYATYFGGTGDEIGYDIWVASNGYVYVTGQTTSDDLPTTTGPDYDDNGDVFVAKFSSTLSSLIYCTYLGGSSQDFAMGIVVDSSGNAYVTGQTYSNDFPTTWGVLQSTFGGGTKDAFVAKFNTNGGLVYSTYLGGSDWDGGNDIEVDSSGNAYVTGFTRSDTITENFPATFGCYDGSLSGLQDAFVAKLNSGATALTYCTYLGGSVYEHAHGIVRDVYNQVCVTGLTDSDDFPTDDATEDPFQDTYGGGDWDGFVTILNAAGTGLFYSTYLGGTGTDWGSSVDYEAANSVGIYVTGLTQSSNFPICENPEQEDLAGTQDAFVTRLDPGAGDEGLIYSSYLGGDGDEHGFGIREYENHAYVAGITDADGFPVSPMTAMQPSYDDGDEGFAARLSAP